MAPDTGPLPLVLGVTGHRDLRPEDVPGLEARVEGILQSFQARYPRTPLVLLSPLAEGADRAAARAALRCGARLEVPLPLPREEYLRDFASAGSRAEFAALLERAERVFELPLMPGSTVEAIRGSAERRAHQYALVGAYLACRSQVLIALWDGVTAPDVGGTAEVVRYRREGIPEPYEALLTRAGDARFVLEPQESGPLIHIVTPRRDHPGIEGEPLEIGPCCVLRAACCVKALASWHACELPSALTQHAARSTQHGSEATFERICANIEAFNESALQLAEAPALRESRDRNAESLLPDADAAALPHGLHALRELYATADTLAQHFRGLTFRTLARLCVLGFVALLSFELSAKLLPGSGLAALIYPLMLAATYLYWGATVRRGRWQDRYQDYRALAEGLRVQFYWSLAGLPASVADHYLRKQRGELDWIRIAIRNVCSSRARCTVQGVPRARGSTAHALALEHWVSSQACYFTKAAHRDERRLERFEMWVKGLMIASPLVALGTALAMLLPTPLAHWIHEQVHVHKLLIVAVFLLAGVAGVLHTYADKLGLAQHVKQYQRMGRLFLLAEARLQQALADGGAGADRVLLELGTEALAENGDWVLTHRERPVDVPHAG